MFGVAGCPVVALLPVFGVVRSHVGYRTVLRRWGEEGDGSERQRLPSAVLLAVAIGRLVAGLMQHPFPRSAARVDLRGTTEDLLL